jgi:hypothetical protein
MNGYIVRNPMHRQVMQEYDLDGQNPRLYEGDHLVSIESIEIGGCSGPNCGCNFHANYWPEIWDGSVRLELEVPPQLRVQHKARQELPQLIDGRLPPPW